MKRHLLSTLALVVAVLTGTATSIAEKEIQADIRRTKNGVVITNLDELDWEDATLSIEKIIKTGERDYEYVRHQASLGVMKAGERLTHHEPQ